MIPPTSGKAIASALAIAAFARLAATPRAASVAPAQGGEGRVRRFVGGSSSAWSNWTLDVSRLRGCRELASELAALAKLTVRLRRASPGSCRQRISGTSRRSMDYRGIFEDAVDALRQEKRYRVFADLERDRRAVSRARSSRHRRQCARDHHLVLQRLSRHGPAPQGDRGHAGDGRQARRRRRRHAQHLRHQPAAGRARALARRPAPQGSGAGLHLGLRLQRGGDLDHRAAAAGLRDLLRPAQPRLDDPGRAPERAWRSRSSATTTWRICATCWRRPSASGPS